jgi:mannose/fructose/N-acetylgalactosamine-specific phosphotransferase system component IIC
MVPTELLVLGGLGGLLSLDGTAVGQFMVSRPLVAGALTGWVLGDAALGLTVGAVLELYLLVSFPTGGARFPEGSTATVVAVAAAAPFSGAGAVAIAAAVGLVWGQIGGASVNVQRHLNSSLVPEPGDPSPGGLSLQLAHTVAIASDFFRGALLTVVGVFVGRLTVGLLVERWPMSSGSSTGLLLVGGAVSAGILLHDLGGFRRRRVLFAAGLALGVVGTRFL